MAACSFGMHHRSAKGFLRVLNNQRLASLNFPVSGKLHQSRYKCRPIAPSRAAQDNRTALSLRERSAALAGLNA
jgi:hypothetical protein